MKQTHPFNNILIVDDTPENLTVLRRILTEEGYRVRPALTGEMAIRTIFADLPDLILLDIAMPEMDGYELAGRIRENGNHSGTTLVALTGYGQDADRKRARDAGFDFHLVKPVGVGALQDLLNSLPQEGE